MPYEHQAEDAAPKAPAWTQHPAIKDLMCDGLFALAFIFALLAGAPEWLVVATSVVLLASLSLTVAREVRRRRSSPPGRRG